MDMIPLRKFLPSSGSDRRQKEVGPSRSRPRGLVEASDEDEAPTSLTVPNTQGKKARIASQPAPLSDDSDFDRNDEQDEDNKKRKPGRPNKSDRKSRKSDHQGKPKGSRTNGKTIHRSSSASADEFDVASDDSQTFVGFKMRDPGREQVRLRNEREEQKSQKSRKSARAFIDLEADEDDSGNSDDPDSAKVIPSTSMKSQSVQVARPKPRKHADFEVDESWPYHLMNYGPFRGQEAADENVEMLEALVEKKVDLPEGGSKSVLVDSYGREIPYYERTLLDLLLDKHHHANKSSKKRSMSRSSSTKGSDEDSNPEDQSQQNRAHVKAGSPKQAEKNVTPMAHTSEKDDAVAQPMQIDEDVELLSSEDEGHPLIFDTNLGKLNRSLPSCQSWRSANLEDGQSEEEDGYQATIADEKAPKRSEPAYWKYALARAQTIKKENAEAERTAKKLKMRPDFTCSAEKQRKQPYRLDPFDKKMVVPISLSRFLRRYQRIGIQFFYDRYKGINVEGIGMVKGGILGDDMGLGKTIQVLGFLSAIMGKTGTKDDLLPQRSRKGRVRDREGPCTPFTFGPTCLIVCPKTLITNWSRELETWTYIEYGAIESKADIQNVVQKYKNGFLDVVLVSFDQLVNNIDTFRSTSFSVMIIDEAHTIKNPSAARSKAMKSVKADCRFAMTGTFIQNRFTEMWSVLDFVVPALVGKYSDWKRKMAKTVDKGMDQKATVQSMAMRKRITDRLHKIVLPLLFLRRTKAAVALELPKKNDHVVFCPLTQVQELVYRRIEAQPDLQAFLQRNSPCPNHPQKSAKDCCFPGNDDADEVDKGIVFRYIDIFKKVSSHIGLVYSQPEDSREQESSADAGERPGGTNVFSNRKSFFPPSREQQLEQRGLISAAQAVAYIPEDIAVIGEELSPTARDPYYRNLPSFKANILSEFSGKWVILNTLLRSWKDDVQGKHKVLIFSSSVKLLKMLQDFMQMEHINCEMLHGGVRDEDRVAAVDRFQRPDSNVFVFLISTLAGGVGLNLTAANKVVIFDPNWNPAHDLQAMDRAFRMGQKRDVDVYRLISLGTIEENIYERQVRKSSAMRIIYDDAADSRLYEGYEERGVTGDLWGVNNLFTYSPEGTSLQRAAKLASEEAQLADNLRDIVSDRLTTLKIDTSYEDGGEELLEGTERGTEAATVSEDATLLEAVGEFFPGLRRERVKAPTQNNGLEQIILERAVEDYENNPAARDRPANEYYRDAAVTKNIKAKRTSAKRKSDGADAEKERKAPRLTVAKSERPAGLVSDDDD